jgi:aryl-alcohol dehydrogenase-like predicted oxidoreductase
MNGTDLRPSRICLGTAEFGTGINRDDSFALMDAFLEAGGNFLDSAHIYADWLSETKGMSERTIGEWMSSRGCRDRVIVGTKGGHGNVPFVAPRLAPQQIHEDLTESLRRLQIDHIDLYWLHRDDTSIPVEQILDTLETERRAGLIRWYAASNWTTSRLREAARHAQLRGIPGMVASQIRWSLATIDRESVEDKSMLDMDDESWGFHRETDLSVVPYSPQAAGFFSGKYSLDRSESGRPEVRKCYGSQANWNRLERAHKLARELQCTANQIALAYLVSQPFPVFPITGCRSLEQVSDSCTAATIHLTPEHVKYLENEEAKA